MTKRKADKLLCNLVKISVLEDYIDMHVKDHVILGIYTKQTNVLIYLLSSLCWTYILVRSLHTLPENFILLFLPTENNPFSHSFILEEIYDPNTFTFKE